MRKPTEKPPYKVPSMADIAALPTCGLRAASTFSGAGGSCLGLKMAGFNVVWANEFIAAARETYTANFPSVPIDGRDIRLLQPDDVFTATGLKKGELDLLDGSPPCASFSTAGKKEAGWGKVRKYSDTKQRVDDLFFEFVRILDGLQPRAFVAENVKGLVIGTAKGYFKSIFKALENCGYVVEAKVLDAKWLGVPQSRQRVFFCGMRKDLGLKPSFPKPIPYQYTVRDAIGDLIENQIVVHETKGQPQYSGGDITNRPSVTILQSAPCAFRVEYGPDCDGDDFEKISIERFAIGREAARLKPGQGSDKYFNLQRLSFDSPSITITQTGGNVGAAAVVHPSGKRKLTIAELKRLCSFPDDFVLTGTYKQQWERLGRAVPPLMMRAMAFAVRDRLLGAS